MGKEDKLKKKKRKYRRLYLFASNTAKWKPQNGSEDHHPDYIEIQRERNMGNSVRSVKVAGKRERDRKRERGTV